MLYGPEYESSKMFSLTCDEPAEETLRCGSCGQPVTELEACTWDPTLQVGACCKTHPDVCEVCGYDHEDCRCFSLVSPTEMPRLPRISIQPVTPNPDIWKTPEVA